MTAAWSARDLGTMRFLGATLTQPLPSGLIINGIFGCVVNVGGACRKVIGLAVMGFCCLSERREVAV